MHGSWLADVHLTTSDRRLKTHITPLHQKMAEEMDSQEMANGTLAESNATATIDADVPYDEKSSAVTWVLRELRPVSFSFKQGPESKFDRYGFVAQELEKVLPNVVRTSAENYKYVVYQDLIALLTMSAQVQEDR